MVYWLIGRVLQGALTVVLLLVAVFSISRATGDPTFILLPVDAPNSQITELRETLGLNESYPIQFWRYVKGTARGDFGVSVRSRIPAVELVRESASNTIILGVTSTVFAILVACPAGILAALKRGSAIDALIRTIAVMGLGMPSFVIAILLIALFSVTLNLLPPVGMGGFRHFVMPVIAMSAFSLAALTRLIRSALLEALDSSYVRFARLKGVPETRVVAFHALPNTLLPVVTFIGVNLALLVSGTTVVETVFGWPGVGRLAFDAVRFRDFPVLQAVIVLVGVAIVVVSLVFDLFNAVLDPRVRVRG